MKIHFFSIVFLCLFLTSRVVQGSETLALFEDGSLAAGSGSTVADRNLAASVIGLDSVPDLSVSLSRTANSARATFNGNINTGNSSTDNWLAAAMSGVPTTPAAGTSYFEINLISSNGYVFDLERISFDWQVANNTNANAINFSCAVFVDSYNGNGFVQVGNALTNSASKTGTTAGFGTLQRDIRLLLLRGTRSFSKLPFALRLPRRLLIPD
ncbi:MAG: hypothetical protein LBV12_02180, partial [Puniceicoccales bacterium]|nr:hypothetical protein [Puniceicoccales bacterium]